MNEYISNFSEYIAGLIRQKQSIGFKYATEARVLKQFDAFCSTHYPAAQTLDKDIVLHWSQQRIAVHPATLQGRITPVRELARYMMRNGQQAFILPSSALFTIHL